MNPIKFVTNSFGPSFAPGERGHTPSMRESMLFRLAVTQEAVSYALDSRTDHDSSVAASIIRNEVELDTPYQTTESTPIYDNLVREQTESSAAVNAHSEADTATEAARKLVDDAWAA